MSRIQVLADHIANQIAAGEVIERPAAAVKELVENSLDAGATKIAITFKDGGKSYLCIEDDGYGMSPADARLCIERHATSKLADASDLQTIQTFGFRGEALPSIASISRFTLQTKRAEDTQGHELFVNAGHIEYERACGRPQGTRIEIANLFQSVPARRKFLKTEATEAAHIIQLCRLYAIANPSITFSLHEGKRLIFKSPRCANLKDRIREIWGHTLASKLIPLEATEQEGIKISGLIGGPGESRSSNQEVMTLINGRPIDSSILKHALRDAYHTHLPKGRSPIAFLFIEMDPARVDVNVHPAKREVRFREEGKVYAIVLEGVKNQLARTLEEATPALPTLERKSTLSAPAIQPKNSSSNTAPLPIEKTFSPITQKTHKAAEPAAKFHAEQAPAPSPSLHWKFLAPTSGRYLLFQSDSGLILLDYRAAHRRVLYDSLLKSWKESSAPSQPLLFPESIELDPISTESIDSQLDLLNKTGFEIERFGKMVFRIHAVPAWLQLENLQSFIQDFISKAQEGLLRSKQSDLIHETLAKIATQHAATTALPQTEHEASRLALELLATSNPLASPSGHRTYFELSQTEIQRKLGH